MTEAVSLRAFAKQMGVRDNAVRKAIRSGRLSRRSVGEHRGRPAIIDPVLAAREWTANAGQARRRSPSAPRSAPSSSPTSAPSSSPSSTAPSPTDATQPPADLSGAARARWDAVLPQLRARGPVDEVLLANYCEVWGRWQHAEAGIKQAGTLIRGARGNVQASPLLTISRQAFAQVKELEKSLGLHQVQTIEQPEPEEAREPEGLTLVAAQRATVLQRERKLRIENDQREQRLLPIEDLTRSQAGMMAAIRARMLALPHVAVLHGLPVEHAPLIEQLVKAALTELSGVQTFADLEAMG